MINLTLPVSSVDIIYKKRRLSARPQQTNCVIKNTFKEDTSQLSDAGYYLCVIFSSSFILPGLGDLEVTLFF